jgi:hypothetical protein
VSHATGVLPDKIAQEIFMIDEKQIEKAFNDFDAAAKSGGAAGTKAIGAAANPCGIWHSIRGTVDAIITALRALGTLFPIARRAADVLETLKNLLNGLCP